MMVTVEVPYKLILNASLHSDSQALQETKRKIVAKDTEFLNKPFQASDERNSMTLDPSLIMSLWLFIIENKNPTSLWRSYLDLLPKRIDSALYWSEEELKIIEGTNLYDGCKQLKQLLNELLQFMQTMDETITLEELYFAYSSFSSRAFPIQIPQDPPLEPYQFKPIEDTIALNNTEAGLLPFIDIFNHSNNSQATYYCNSQTRIFQLELEPTMNTLELFNNYGKKTNESFILSYGFYIESNPQDAYWVQLALDHQDPNRDTKILKLNSKGYPMRYDILKGSIPNELYGAMRICLMNQQELFLDQDPGAPINFNNEMKMFSNLEKLLTSRLKRITKEQPRTESRCTKMALFYRNSQITILKSAIEAIHADRRCYIESKHIGSESFSKWDMVLKSWYSEIPGHPTFSSGDIVLSIPLEYCIHRDSVLSSPVGKIVKMNGLEDSFDDDLLILLYLIYSSQDVQSKHHDFVKSCNVSDIYTCKESIVLMRNLGLCSDLDYHLENIDSYFKDLSSILNAIDDPLNIQVTQENTAWAYAFLLSFGHEVALSPSHEILAILPFHSHSKYDANSSYDCIFDESSEKVNIQVTGKVSSLPRLHVYHNYNQKDNLTMLLEHGFLIENNAFDSIAIDIEINEDELTDRKINLLNEFGANGPYYISLSPIASKLMLAMRIWAINKEELDKLSDTFDLNQVISPRNEMAAKAYLKRKLEELLSVYMEKQQLSSQSKVYKYLSELEKIVYYNLNQLK